MDSATQARIAKLLPMLGSDQPGEVLAAVSRLRSTLAGAGLDLHDLARGKTGPTVVAPNDAATIMVLRGQITELKREVQNMTARQIAALEANAGLRKLLAECEAARKQAALPLAAPPRAPQGGERLMATSFRDSFPDPRKAWLRVLAGDMTIEQFNTRHPDWVDDSGDPEGDDETDDDGPDAIWPNPWR